MTASDITKALGIAEGTKTIKFQEPVVFSQTSRYMPEQQFTITSAEVTERKGWTQIILRGTEQSSYSPGVTNTCLKWDQFKAPARHLLEKAILMGELDN